MWGREVGDGVDKPASLATFGKRPRRRAPDNSCGGRVRTCESTGWLGSVQPIVESQALGGLADGITESTSGVSSKSFARLLRRSHIPSRQWCALPRQNHSIYSPHTSFEYLHSHRFHFVRTGCLLFPSRRLGGPRLRRKLHPSHHHAHFYPSHADGGLRRSDLRG